MDDGARDGSMVSRDCVWDLCTTFRYLGWQDASWSVREFWRTFTLSSTVKVNAMHCSPITLDTELPPRHHVQYTLHTHFLLTKSLPSASPNPRALAYKGVPNSLRESRGSRGKLTPCAGNPFDGPQRGMCAWHTDQKKRVSEKYLEYWTDWVQT